MPLTKAEEKAVLALLDALTDWPCERFETKRADGTVERQPGGRHYSTDYTVARARKSHAAYRKALRAFPQLVAGRYVETD